MMSKKEKPTLEELLDQSKGRKPPRGTKYQTHKGKNKSKVVI